VTPAERTVALDEIAAEVRGCTQCRLSTGRTHAVPGEGSPDTEVVFVGEGPGQNEDQQGRPFVGAAGGLLTELVGSIGWKRDQVFITNVVKCRPPGNRDPEPDEMAACAPFLRRQLEVLDPALVVTLGRYSLGTFMPGTRIGQVHGTSRPVDPATGARDAVAFAMYHPAAAFRQLSLKETMREDMARIPDVLIEARRGRGSRPSDGPDASDMAEEITPDLPAAEPEPTPDLPAGDPARAATATDLPAAENAATTEPAPVPAPMTADPVEPEPIVPADDIAEALAAGVDTHAIPQEPPPETDQMRLF
jgi:uracil-DNA glycosylase family 4